MKQTCCVHIWLIQNSKIYSCISGRGQIELMAICSLKSIDINTITVHWFKITILFTAKTCIYLKIAAIICEQYVFSVFVMRCIISSYIWHLNHKNDIILCNMTHFNNQFSNSQTKKHFHGILFYITMKISWIFITTNIITN